MQLVEQLQTKTEEGQTALAIATRTGSVATWKAVANKIAEGEVRAAAENLCRYIYVNTFETCHIFAVAYRVRGGGGMQLFINFANSQVGDLISRSNIILFGMSALDTPALIYFRSGFW